MIPGGIIFYVGYKHHSTGLMWFGGIWFVVSLVYLVVKLNQHAQPTTVPVKV